MLHAVDRDIRDEGDGVVVVLKRDIHILLIDIHVIRDDLDDVILEVVHDFWRDIGAVMDQHDLEAVMRDLPRSLFLAKNLLDQIQHAFPSLCSKYAALEPLEKALLREFHEGDVLAADAANDVAVGLSCKRVLHRDARLALIGARDDHLVVRHLADALDREDVVDIVHVEHVTALDHLRADAVDDELNVLLVGARELTDDLVGIADSRDFRHRHDDRRVSGGDGRLEALLDTGGAVDEDEVELLAQVLAELDELLWVDARLVLDLGGRQQEEALILLVAHEGLLAGHAAFSHIDEVVHDAVLEAEEQIEIAQARIRVDENDFLAAHGEADAEVCRRRRLADTALSTCNCNYPCIGDFLIGLHAFP